MNKNVDMTHINTPIPEDYTRKRPWSYCIKELSNDFYRLIRGADLQTVMGPSSLNNIKKHVARLKKIDPNIIIKRT